MHRETGRHLRPPEAAAVCPAFVLELGPPRLAQDTAEKSPPRSQPVVYFVGDYVELSRSGAGAGAVWRCWQHNGIGVHVPPGQTSSGMAMISAGDLEAARIVAEQNVRELAELAREGYPIVCTEPTVGPVPEARISDDSQPPRRRRGRVAGDRRRGLSSRGCTAPASSRPTFGRSILDVAYHTPCHLKALECGTPLADLLSLIPATPVA